MPCDNGCRDCNSAAASQRAEGWRPPSEAGRGGEGFFPIGNTEGFSTVILDF